MRRLGLVAAMAAALAGCGGDDGEPPAALTLGQCFADVAAPGSRFVEIQDYATADGRYRIRRSRQPGSRPSVGETIPYDLIRFGVESGGTRECIRERDRLTYRFEHHNWDDTMEARGTAATYRVNEAYELSATVQRWKFTLTVLGPDGAVKEGPLPLDEGGCRTLPYDLNGCPVRRRTDAP